MEPLERVNTSMQSKASHMQERMSDQQEQAGSNVRADRAQVDEVIDDLPDPPRQIAEKTMERYGPPNDVSYSKLIW